MLYEMLHRLRKKPVLCDEAACLLVFCDQDVREAKEKNLPYHQYVIDEILRLIPQGDEEEEEEESMYIEVCLFGLNAQYFFKNQTYDNDDLEMQLQNVKQFFMEIFRRHYSHAGFTDVDKFLESITCDGGVAMKWAKFAPDLYYFPYSCEDYDRPCGYKFDLPSINLLAEMRRLRRIVGRVSFLKKRVLKNFLNLNFKLKIFRKSVLVSTLGQRNELRKELIG